MAEPKLDSSLRDHAVIVGYGHVGTAIAPVLQQAAVPFVVVERDRRLVSALHDLGLGAIGGEASVPEVLDAAGVRHARVILITTTDGFQARCILEVARALNPRIRIAIGAHREAEIGALKREGADAVLIGEHELATAMAEYALTCAKTDIEHEDEPKESA